MYKHCNCDFSLSRAGLAVSALLLVFFWGSHQPAYCDNKLESLQRQCKQLLHEKKKKEVLKLMESEIAARPADAGLYFLRAKVREDLKDYEGMIKDLDRAIAISPRYTDAFVLRARANFMLSEMTVSNEYANRYVKDVEAALKLNPSHPAANDARGVYLASRSNYKDAIAAFSKAIAGDKTEYVYFEHRAMAYNALGDRKKALADLQKATSLTFESYDIWVHLAETYDALGQYNQALDCYDKVIKAKPKKIPLVQKRGNFFMKWHRYKEAIADFDRVIADSAFDDDVFRLRGEAHLALKQFDPALKDFNEAIELSPELSENYGARARAYRAMGKIDLARKDEAKALEVKNHRIK